MSQNIDRKSRIPVRTLDLSRYAETFAVFVARSYEYPAMIERLVGVANALPANFSCLDIGAGPGKVLQDWLANGGRRPDRYVAIEPNPAHAEDMRQTLLSHEINGEVIENAFEPKFPIPGTHDLVLFSHSLYWTPDPIGCVRHTYSTVRPGGCILAFLQGPFGFYSYFHLFNPLFLRDRHSGPDHGFSSHELIQGLRSAGFEPHIIFEPTLLDMTGLFEDGATEERDEFLSFCLQIEFSTLPDPIKTDAIAYVETACIKQDGRLLWHHPTATVQLSKPSKSIETNA